MMFSRLFGDTEEEQIEYLQKKVIVTSIGLVVVLVGILLGLLALATSSLSLESVATTIYSGGSAILMVSLFIWGFGAIKRLFGIGTIGALFTGNIVFGVVIFVICIMAAYFVSLFILLMGMGRYIYLKVKARQEGR